MNRGRRWPRKTSIPISAFPLRRCGPLVSLHSLASLGIDFRDGAIPRRGFPTPGAGNVSTSEARDALVDTLGQWKER